jgi:2-haloacid dehalogenase
MTRDTELRAVVFDAYGTLFDVTGLSAECERRFPGHGTKLSQTWRAKQLEYSWLRSLMDRYEDFGVVTEGALAYACRAAGLELDGEARRSLLQGYLRLAPYADAAAALRVLAPLPRVILSNGTPFMLRELVRNAGFESLIDHVYSVDDVKVFKPSPRVYAMACERLGATPRQIAFISSNRWDVSGAASYGLRTFWINRSGQPDDSLPGDPAATFGDLGAFAAMLTRDR